MLTSICAGPQIRELEIKARRIAVGLGTMSGVKRYRNGRQPKGGHAGRRLRIAAHRFIVEDIQSRQHRT
jgi:hypothetical protein